MDKKEIETNLEKIAFARTTPFCYSCYEKAPSGRCLTCGSDDLMRHLGDIGVEYGTDWVIKSIIHEELTAIDVKEAFEESISDCYESTVKIGWIEYDTVSAIKELDPHSWEMAQNEWLEFEQDDDRIIEIGGRYYWFNDVEQFIDDNLEDSAA